MSTAPYPGLRPFLEEEADVYFGREEQSDQLLERLGASRFLAVVGPSGCGKSSLVRAGMIAALRTGFLAPAGSNWRIATMKPRDHPVSQLALALLESESDGQAKVVEPYSIGFLNARLRSGPRSLLKRFQESPLAPRENVLILVDQFEEIFRFRKEGDRDEADAFVALLLETARARDLPIYVVITMRSDYLGDCALFTGLPEVLSQSQYLTPRLTREQRRAAIVGPARVFGGDVDEDLVNLLLNDSSGDPGKLPVLQHLLMRMWTLAQADAARAAGTDEVAAQAPSVRLTTEHYGGAGGFSGALSQHADEAFARLTEPQQRVARFLFRSLSDRSTRKEDNRRPAPVSEVAQRARVEPSEVIEVANVFRDAECSFITPAPPEQLHAKTVLDISHESLIRQWWRLDAWATEEASAADVYRDLDKAASKWQQAERAQNALYDGLALDTALAWRHAESPDSIWATRYGGDFQQATNFLDASATRRRWKRRAMIAASVLLALAIGSTIAIVSWSLNAMASDRRNTVRFLSSESISLTEEEPQLAALLATQAYNFDLQFGTKLGVFVDRGLRAQLRQPNFPVVRTGVYGSINDVAFSPDGTLLAAASSDRSIAIWRRTDGKTALHMLDDHRGVVNALVFIDGSRVASGSSDHTVRVWNLGDPTSPPIVLRHDDLVRAVAASRDGRLLASASSDGTIRIWRTGDIATNDEPFMKVPVSKKVTSLAFSPAGDQLVIGSDDAANALVVLRLDGADTRPQPVRHDAAMYAVAFDPTGPRVAIVQAGGSISILDTADWKDQYTFANGATVSSISFSPDGKQLATSSRDGVIRVWSLGARRAAARPIELTSSRGDPVMAVRFSPDGDALLSGGHDSRLRIWNMRNSSTDSVVLSKSNRVVTAVAVAERSRLLAAASTDGKIRIWEGGDTTRPHYELVHNPDASRRLRPANALAFDRAGERLVSAGTDGAVRIWAMSSPQAPPRTLTIKGARSPKQNAVALSPDGLLVAAGGTDQVIRIWDLSRDDAPCLLRGHEGEVTALAFVGSTGQLVSGSADATVRIWNSTDCAAAPRLLTGHLRTINALAVSPDSSELVSVGADRMIYLWDLKHLDREPQAYGPHERAIWTVAFSQSGTQLAIGDSKGIIKIWDRNNLVGKPRTLIGGTDTVRSIAFIDEQRLISGSEDHEVRLWLVSNDVLAAAACDRLRDNVANGAAASLSPAEWDRYVGKRAKHAPTCPAGPDDFGLATNAAGANR